MEWSDLRILLPFGMVLSLGLIPMVCQYFMDKEWRRARGK